MTTDTPLSFTRIEIESYLPLGWTLDPEQPEGAWDAAKQAWRGTFLDSVEFRWPVEVTAGAARRLGRLEALRQAFDHAYRQRLGRPTRGLGRASKAARS